MATPSVRYIVDDVTAAVDFYTGLLGFEAVADQSPAFAIVARDGLRLLLSAPRGPGGAARPMPDGSVPEPGGWNRIQMEVADVAAEAARLRESGARFRGDLVTGRGGIQILLEDPSGNLVELFQPAG